MESIGKAVLIFMLAVKSLSPSLGPKSPTDVSFIPDPNRPYVIRIAMLPLDNVTSDANATEKLNDTLLSYMLHTQVVGVVDPDLVEQVLFDQKIRKTAQITPKIGKDIKGTLRVDAFLAGKITAYQVDNTGGDSVPVIAVNLRLLDPETMDIIWSASIVRKGNDKSVLFDVGRIETLSDLSQLVANDLASALGKQVADAVAGYRKKTGATLTALTAPAPAAPAETKAAAPVIPSPVASAKPVEKPAEKPAEKTAPAAPAEKVAPIANLKDYLLDVDGFTKEEVELRSHGVQSVSATYRKGNSPIFVKMMDCGNEDQCKKLQAAVMIGADEGNVQINGCTGNKSHGKMGLLEYYAVYGRFLLIMSAGDALGDDMKLLGAQLLRHTK